MGEDRAGAADERVDGGGDSVGKRRFFAGARADEAGGDKGGDEAALLLAPPGDLLAGPGQGQEAEREPLGDVGAAPPAGERRQIVGGDAGDR